MRHSAAAPAVVLSPHLDDAVLSTWAVLTGAGDLLVVNVCDGVPEPGFTGSWDRRTGNVESAEAMRLRLAEDEEALGVVGRRAVGLGFLDAQYREEPLDPEAVADALGGAVPEASALHAPAGIGGHLDHTAARDAAFALAGAVPLSLYADLPYAARLGWPRGLDGGPPDGALRPEGRWSAYLAGAPCAQEELEPRAIRLSAEQLAAKRRALEAYRTQYPSLSVGRWHRVSGPEVLEFELCWDVRSGEPARRAE